MLDHFASGCLTDEEQRFEIDVVDGIPILFGYIFGELSSVDACAVHQNVDSPHLSDACVDQFFSGTAFRQIQGFVSVINPLVIKAFGKAQQFLLICAVEIKRCSSATQKRDDRLAYTAGGTCNQNGSVLQGKLCIHHFAYFSFLTLQEIP